MQRLSYRLTVQSDGAVQALLDTGEEVIPAAPGKLDLSQLDMITQDYLPLLEGQPKHTRQRLERFGALLYRLLFAMPVAGHFEELAWRRVEDHPDRYRLALLLTLQEGLRPDVAALPWEFLYCPRGQAFLATDRRVTLVRCYSDWVSLRNEPLFEDEQLRVLLVRLQPETLEPVALTPIKNFLNELAKASSRLLAPVVLENPRPLAVEDALNQYRPHIFHLLAHGYFKDRGTAFGLVDETGRTVRWYGDRSLADLFRVARPRLVLLQACEGGRTSDVLSFANGAAWLVRGHIPAVIAMHYPITNRVGWLFAQTLYERLVEGDELDVAVQRARLVLARSDEQSPDDHSGRDFAAPILWMRPEARFIFQEHPMEESMITLTIATPDGARFEAAVPPDTLINQLLQAFLGEWQPLPAMSTRPQRYWLRPDAPNQAPLDRASTLREAGIPDTAKLMLTAEPLEPDSPVGLTIEDERGQRFTTAVLLSTRIGPLAETFLQQTEQAPHPGGIIVDVIDSLGVRPRRLRLDASLYDEGVSDDALLRIYRGTE